MSSRNDPQERDPELELIDNLIDTACATNRLEERSLLIQLRALISERTQRR